MCINRAPKEEKGKNKRIGIKIFQSQLNYIDLYIQRVQHNLNGQIPSTFTFMEVSGSKALKAGGKLTSLTWGPQSSSADLQCLSEKTFATLNGNDCHPGLLCLTKL